MNGGRSSEFINEGSGFDTTTSSTQITNKEDNETTALTESSQDTPGTTLSEQLKPVPAVPRGTIQYVTSQPNKEINRIPTQNTQKKQNIINLSNIGKRNQSSSSSKIEPSLSKKRNPTTKSTRRMVTKRPGKQGKPRVDNKELATSFHDKKKIYHKELPLYMYAHMMKYLYFPTDYYTHFDQFLKRWQRFIDTQEKRDKLKLKYINTSQIILPSNLKSSSNGVSLTKLFADKMSKLRVPKLRIPKLSGIAIKMFKSSDKK